MKEQILDQLDFCIDRLISLSQNPRLRKLMDCETDLGEIAIRLSALRDGVADDY